MQQDFTGNFRGKNSSYTLEATQIHKYLLNKMAADYKVFINL